LVLKECENIITVVLLIVRMDPGQEEAVDEVDLVHVVASERERERPDVSGSGRSQDNIAGDHTDTSI